MPKPKQVRKNTALRKRYENGVLVQQQCTKCDAWKAVMEFGVQKSLASGYTTYCKECKNLKNVATRDAIKADLRQLQEEEPERTKFCPDCGHLLSITQFAAYGLTADGFEDVCKQHAAQRRAARTAMLQAADGLTKHQRQMYNALLQDRADGMRPYEPGSRSNKMLGDMLVQAAKAVKCHVELGEVDSMIVRGATGLCTECDEPAPAALGDMQMSYRLDRQVPGKTPGYTLANTVPMCITCNRGKNNLPYLVYKALKLRRVLWTICRFAAGRVDPRIRSVASLVVRGVEAVVQAFVSSQQDAKNDAEADEAGKAEAQLEAELLGEEQPSAGAVPIPPADVIQIA